MTLVALESIERRFGEHVVLDGVGMSIDEGDRVGLIGDNGAGKTTLLRVLTGLDQPDRGSVTPRRGLKIAYLAQIPAIPPGTSVLEFVERGNGEFQGLEARIRALESRLAAAPDDPAALEEYGRLQGAFEAGGGYHRRATCQRVLSGLGFTAADWDKDASVQSGGEKTRTMLAELMTTPADLLVLDEPTNHLDLDGIEFLEGYLARYPGAVLVVSHDRAFLDGFAKVIVELEGGSLTRYRGNWSAYMQQRDASILAAARAFRDQQEFVAKEMEYIRRNMAGRNSGQAKGRLKRLQRLERIQAPRPDRTTMKLRFRGGRGQQGQAILEAEDLVLTVPGGRRVIDGASFRVDHGETVGILGRNGAGKSTLLRCLAGLTTPAGGRLQRAYGVRAAYFSQEMQDLPRSGTVLEALRAVDPKALEGDLRSHLALFLFRGDEVERPVESLSGGEKRRVCLARLTRGTYDFLCLDEPTNHLDVPAREGLEEALLAYPGAVVMVSHDRTFLGTLADRILLVEDGRVRAFDGGLPGFLRARAAEQREARAEEREAKDRARARDERAPPAAGAAPGGKVRNPLLFQKLEEKIIALEEQVATLRQRMLLPENYASHAAMRALQDEEARVQADLAEAYQRWENWV
ncbi:MAG: ABC-F family ATP-binding cassette domain-containing protein [Planctomycetes bacterium]|nr:ABC-F family ATP-binding cassette domain-containing protein [Planctomycetota bacterium]